MKELDIVSFGKSDIENALEKMSPGEIDKLAFGAIELDKTGTILKYNSAEGAITGRNPADVIGKNFFRDVAPCTSKASFKGVFDTGALADDLTHWVRAHLPAAERPATFTFGPQLPRQASGKPADWIIAE